MASFDDSSSAECVTSVESGIRHRSRNMMLMHERFGSSRSNLDDHFESDDGISDLFSLEQGDGAKAAGLNGSSACKEECRSPSFPTKPALTTQEPEHIGIATRLSRAHKIHVDRIMVILRIEMDALRDMDRLLEESGRLSEEEVLDYFESVGLCLDQRRQTSTHLQHELDLISRGALH